MVISSEDELMQKFYMPNTRMHRHETLEAKKNIWGVTNCPVSNVQQHSPCYFSYQSEASILSPACHNTHLDHFPPTDD